MKLQTHIHIDMNFQMRLDLVTFDLGCLIVQPYSL